MGSTFSVPVAVNNILPLSEMLSIIIPLESPPVELFEDVFEDPRS